MTKPSQNPGGSFAGELKRLVATATWSVQGWRQSWTEEKSLRQWATVNILTWILLAFLRPGIAESAVCVGMGFLVMAAELMNTGIEAAVDHTSTERHPLAKKAKDAASAAVMTTAIGWAVVLVLTLAGSLLAS
ncbi:MAG: diacylglycerol kinase [Rhodobacteraceae bacterium]|jgi:diacylglycerol kinase (ATP)|nr:diacylglycerol kinase [Paracoccaceae bacterium]